MQPDTATIAPASVTAGLIDIEQLRADLRCSDRTIDRYRKAGMPYIKLGTTILFDPATVREWIMSHERRHSVPKMGRPRKHAA